MQSDLFRHACLIFICRDGDLALLIVGPEGDFTPAEVDSMVAAGAVPVGLGSLRLRVETAAIGLLAAVTTYHRSRQPALLSSET